jgi:hypothetical protein
MDLFKDSFIFSLISLSRGGTSLDGLYFNMSLELSWSGIVGLDVIEAEGLSPDMVDSPVIEFDV